MSQNIRWELLAYRPVSLLEVDFKHLPRGLRARVEEGLTRGTGQEYEVRVDWSNGNLNYGESWTWREHEEAMRYMSTKAPELIWQVHAKGEDHQQWAITAYRGVQYRDDMPEWHPPLPNAHRLPNQEAVDIPGDPLGPEAALRMALDQMRHLPTCPAVERPPLILSSHCTCPYGEVAKSLAALETQRLHDRLAPR